MKVKFFVFENQQCHYQARFDDTRTANLQQSYKIDHNLSFRKGETENERNNFRGGYIKESSD